MSKNIPDIINCNLKKNDQILIVLLQVFLTQLARVFMNHQRCTHWYTSVYLLYGIIWWKWYAAELLIIVTTRCKTGRATTNLPQQHRCCSCSYIRRISHSVKMLNSSLFAYIHSTISARRGSLTVVCRHSCTTNCTGWTCQRGSLSSSASWRTVVCMDRHLGTLPITSLQPSKSHLDIGYVPPTDTGSLCLAVDSTHTVVGLFRLLVQRSGTHCQMNSEIRRVMSTASNTSLKQSCSALTGVTSALEVIYNVMRSINPRFTYLLSNVKYAHKTFSLQSFDY